MRVRYRGAICCRRGNLTCVDMVDNAAFRPVFGVDWGKVATLAQVPRSFHEVPDGAISAWIGAQRGFLDGLRRHSIG